MIIKRKNKILSIMLIIISTIIIILKKAPQLYIANIKLKDINTYLEETSQIEETIINNSFEDASKKPKYIAILEIPDISLKNGLLPPEDKYNDIAYNIAILPSSKMPDEINSNLILAAHNGTSNVSYFKDLSKLEKGAIINLYYLGIKYIYKLNNYYSIDKTMEANIVRDRTTNTLTLITCKDGSDDEQIIYIAYLISKEKYWKIYNNLLK